VLCLVKLAEVMLFRDKCDKAKQYAEKALKIAHSKNDKTIEGQC